MASDPSKHNRATLQLPLQVKGALSRSLTANAALVFMVLSAITLFAAMSATVWEPGPGPQPMRDPRIPVLWGVASQLFLVGGAWLAGSAYAGCKVRSILALVLGTVLATWGLLLVV